LESKCKHSPGNSEESGFCLFLTAIIIRPIIPVYGTGIIIRAMIKGLGPKEAELIAILSNTGKRVFSVSEAAKLVGITSENASDLVLQLFKKKKLVRIEKARYLIVPPEAWATGKYTEEGIVIASQLISPYYLSYWTAFSYYGWTEQPSKTIFVATTKQKTTLEVQGMRFQFVRLKAHRFFGYTEQWIGNQKVAVAEREKALVDGLDQPRYCGEIVEVAKGVWNGRKEVNWDTLLDYAVRMKNGAIIKRLGFLLDVLGIVEPTVRKALKKHLTTGFASLDPGSKGEGTYHTEWNIFANVNVRNLTEWRTH